MTHQSQDLQKLSPCKCSRTHCLKLTKAFLLFSCRLSEDKSNDSVGLFLGPCPLQLCHFHRAHICSHLSQKQEPMDLINFLSNEVEWKKTEELTPVSSISQRHSFNPQQSRCWFAILHFPHKLKEDKYLLQNQTNSLLIPKPWFYHCASSRVSQKRKTNIVHEHTYMESGLPMWYQW